MIEVKTVPMVLTKVNTANHANVTHQCFDVLNLVVAYLNCGDVVRFNFLIYKLIRILLFKFKLNLNLYIQPFNEKISYFVDGDRDCALTGEDGKTNLF